MKKLINNLIDDYCSFEVSKLLREKGFDAPCRSHYELAKTSQKDKEDGYSGSFGWKKGEMNIQSDHNTNTSLNRYYNGRTWYACSRPTQSMAIEWLLLNFKIWIQIGLNIKMERYKSDIFSVKPIEYKYTLDGRTKDRPEYGWATPQEAAEEAIKFVLNKMVK